MFNTDYSIRQATNDDIPVIKEIVFEALIEFGLKPEERGKDNDLNDIEKNYSMNNGYFGVLIDLNTDEIIGTFGITKNSNDICELRKMYLRKRERNKGLGKYMMNAAIDIAQEKNYRKIILETISPLKGAISLYRKFGFKEITPSKITDRVDQAFELSIV